MTRTLIKNGTILTVDPRLGDLDRGDVLIEDDRIVEVGRNLAAAGADEIDASRMIVMPGLVNTHIHTWETGLRGIGADWVSHRDYHGNMHGNLATRFGAADNYVANLVGALGQLDGGTTTILDWCHNITSPDMADAALDGLAESGIRAVFGHGTAKPPAKPGDKPYYELPFPREPLARLRKGRLAADDGLLTLAMAILGPDYTSYEIAAEDMRLAREFGVIASAHTWGRPSRKTPDGMLRLARAGLLGTRPQHRARQRDPGRGAEDLRRRRMHRVRDAARGDDEQPAGRAPRALREARRPDVDRHRRRRVLLELDARGDAARVHAPARAGQPRAAGHRPLAAAAPPHQHPSRARVGDDRRGEGAPARPPDRVADARQAGRRRDDPAPTISTPSRRFPAATRCTRW